MNSQSPTRRGFLAMLGAGAAVRAGATGTAGAEDSPAIAEGTPAGAERPPVVRVGDDYFDPVGLFVEPGTTVQFEIAGGSHSATAHDDRIPAGASAFDSAVVSEGTFEHTFETTGTYDYYCIRHWSVGMVGRIVVGEPGGPAEADPVLDWDVPESEVIVEERSVGIDAFEAAGDGGRGTMESMGDPRGSRDETMADGGDVGHGGWTMFLPLGLLTTVLGVAGALAYRAGAGGSGRDAGTDSALDRLEARYAAGEIDEEVLERRRKVLDETE